MINLNPQRAASNSFYSSFLKRLPVDFVSQQLDDVSSLVSKRIIPGVQTLPRIVTNTLAPIAKLVIPQSKRVDTRLDDDACSNTSSSPREAFLPITSSIPSLTVLSKQHSFVKQSEQPFVDSMPLISVLDNRTVYTNALPTTFIEQAPLIQDAADVYFDNFKLDIILSKSWAELAALEVCSFESSLKEIQPKESVATFPIAITFQLEEVPLWASPQITFKVYPQALTELHFGTALADGEIMQPLLPSFLLHNFFTERKALESYIIPSTAYDFFYITGFI